MKTFIKILILTIFLSAGFLTALPVFAVGVDPLIVEYWSETGNNWQPLTGPIFGETNFLPGNNVVRLIRVTNYSGQTQRIAVEAINKSDPDKLGEHLNLVIKGATEIFNDTLKKFFDQGETYLSDVANNASTQYDFTVSFKSDTDNFYQGKSLGFDIVVGFEGTEGGLTPLSPGQGIAGGPGGSNGPPGGLPSGLTIQNETNVQTTTNSVTIIWDTSYPATSQVIYALDSEAHILNLLDNAGSSPKYGYYRTTSESDVFTKVLHHSVTIDSLTSGTKYYFRAVSHGSLAISTEHSFTTLTVEQAATAAVATAAGETVSGTAGGEAVTGDGEQQPGATEENVQNIQGEVGTTTETEKEAASVGLFGGVRNLAATILGLSGSWIFWIILFLILVIILFLILRKKKEKK